MMPRRFILLCSLLALPGLGQASTNCLAQQNIGTAHFIGQWSLTLTGQSGQKPERALLILHPHPSYSDSLKGKLERGAQTLQVVGDWEDDTLTFEESADGVHISGTWQARMVQGQCGAVFEGLRFTGSEPDNSAQRFRMRKVQTRSN